jgi:effector-binding domain-containing protein
MPRISDIDIIEKREQPTIYIRTITKVEQLPMLIGKSYGKLVEYLKNNDSMVSDMPYVAYYNMDMQNLDVEIGFPISNTLSEKG